MKLSVMRCGLLALMGMQAAGFESPREMLAAHNALRASVGAPALAWSDTLARRAQQWADTLLRRGKLAHTPKSPYGENLFAITGGTAPVQQVAAAWADEARDYDYRKNKCRKVCGHYTQMVWAGSRQLGCGVATGKNRQVWVCEYDPPGNRVGRRPY